MPAHAHLMFAPRAPSPDRQPEPRRPSLRQHPGRRRWMAAVWCALALAGAGQAQSGAAVLADAPGLAPVPASAAPVPLQLELRRSAEGTARVFVTLPPGTAPFTPRLMGVGGEFWLDLPFAVAEASGQLGGPVSGYRAQGRRLSLTVDAGFSLGAQFWPAVGPWPPGLVLDAVPVRAAGPLSVPIQGSAPQSAPQAPAPTQVSAPIQVSGPVTAPLLSPPAAPKLGPVRASVILDPGHGGIDPGMTSPWVREADINLDVALRTARLLEAHGVAVTLTRRADTHLHPDKATDLNLRSRMATTGQVSAFISIHVNASASPAAQGTETYYFGQPLPGQGRSLAVRENGGGNLGEALTGQAARSSQGLLGDLLAQAKLSFSRRLAGLVQAELVAATGAQDRGVKTDAFYVIRSPTTPAILTELGFGTHPVEGARLASPEYRQRQAEAVARAVLRFLNAT